MAATRLSDSQKTELVSGFQAGESTQGLADRFGCSANTVIRVARTTLGTVAYEKLKRQRSRSGPESAQAQQLALQATAAEPAAAEADQPIRADQTEPAGGDPDPVTADEPGGEVTAPEDDIQASLYTSHAVKADHNIDEGKPDDESKSGPANRSHEASNSFDDIDSLDSTDLGEVAQLDDVTNVDAFASLDGGTDLDTETDLDIEADLDVVADLDAAAGIDDDSEYGDDDDDLIVDDESADDELEGDLSGEDEQTSFLPIAVVGLGVQDHGSPAELKPLASAELPASVYMLVDKTVELQARALSDIAELGRLPPEEHDRRALVVFTNPRQAKRLCGRTQRVIKLPDTRVIERTAPYLLAQGISRVVIEGALYSLPGS